MEGTKPTLGGGGVASGPKREGQPGVAISKTKWQVGRPRGVVNARRKHCPCALEKEPKQKKSRWGIWAEIGPPDLRGKEKDRQ